MPRATKGAVQRPARPDRDLQAILAGMTVADKVGQLLMPYLDPDTLEEAIGRYRCGTMLLWGNLGPIDPRDVCDLANRAQDLSLKVRRLPLWLHGFAPGLGWERGWLGKVARQASPAEVTQAAEILGRRWRAVGLHNLPEPTVNVPLYDTGIMQAWAISRDPKVVRDYSVALVRGVTRARCGTMAQHFPAHGATPVDSHKGYPVVSLDRATLMRDHLEVYRACFEAGCTSICTAHLACPALDPDPTHIATTSRPILTDFLRGELGFRGLVLGDAIDMFGFQKNGSSEEQSVNAVLAGCDTICMTSKGTDLLGKVHGRLMRAVQDRRIPMDRLDEAVLAHLRFMRWLGLLGGEVRVSPERLDLLLGNEHDRQFLDRIAGSHR